MELVKIAFGLVGLVAVVFLLKDGSIKLPSTFGTVGTMASTARSGASTSDAAKLLDRELPGQILQSPGMALPGRQYALVTDAFQDFSPATETDLPAGVVPLDVMLDCAFRRPATGERIANVAVGGSGLSAAINTLSDGDLAEAATRVLKDQKQHADRNYEPAEFVPPSSMGVVDVILTDASALLYVILQSDGDRVIWNFQVAAGVQVAHVALIAGGDAGIANLDPSLPLQVTTEKTCGIQMAREPGDDWDFVRNTKKGRGDEALLAQHIERHCAYSNWFESQFGQPSEAGLVGFLQADHVLIGPVPKEGGRLAQKSLAGAQVRVTPQDHIVVGPEADRTAALTRLMGDLLNSAVGADFATLRLPQPVKRTE